MTARADVVIVNWNSGDQLGSSVESVQAFGQDFVSKIIVVDNASTDRSPGAVAANESVDLLSLPSNLGFAKACNIGAERGSAEFILFLNPDACLMSSSNLAAPIEFLSGHAGKSFGICGIKLIGEDGSVQRHCCRFPSWRMFVAYSLGLSALLPRLLPTHFMRDFDHNSSRTVDHVIGAFYIVRRDLFESLGGFDTRFFVYLEDLDFSLRARQAGWLTHYFSETTAYHRGGGTSEQVIALRMFYSIRSRLVYSLKYFSRWQFWLVATAALLVEPLVRIFRGLILFSAKDILNVVKCYAMLWREFPKILFPR